MEIALSIHFSTSYVQIPPEVDNGASLFVGGPPRNVSIVLATSWISLIVHPFLGGTLWTHFGLSPSGGIALS